MVLKSRSLTRFLVVLVLITALVLAATSPIFKHSTKPIFAQDDPAAQINALAERVHLQNMRTGNSTRWVGGNIGPMDGTETAAEAGTQFTDWRFTDLYNEATEIRLDSLTRPVTMNIWASWCGPCRFEFPFLTEYALADNNNYDLWFLNANDTSIAAAKRFLRSQATGIITYLDPNDAFIRSIGLRVFPTTILMDTDGTILIAHSGIVTPTVMDFFNAVAANPHVGSIDVSTLPPPDLNAIIGEVDPANATQIVYLQQVAGELNDETWRQLYSFEGHANEEIIINMTTTDQDLDAYLVLVGPDGQRVAENDDSTDGSTNSEIRMTLPTDGTYVIVATRFLEEDGFGSGGFNLQVRTAAQEPGQTGTANILQPGIPSSGRLTFELKQQNYLLDATAGQHLTFTLTHDTPEEQLSLQARLGSERLIPFTRTENGELVVEVDVVTAGSYSVYVARGQDSRAGPITYTLTAEASGGTTTPETPPVTDSSTLTYNSSANSTITDEVPEVRYTFEGNAGDVVSLDMAVVEGSGTLDTYLQLLGPDGSILVENDDADLTTTNSHIGDFTLPESGTYTIVATRFSLATGFTTGDFTLTLSSANVSPETPETSVTAGGYGMAMNGSIDDSQVQQSFTFEGSAGDVVTIEMTADSGNLDTHVTLVAPDGTTLTENDDIDLTNTNSRIADFTLPETGTYTIIASRYDGEDGTSSGTFILSVNGTISENPPVNTPPVAEGSIAFDTPVTGSITEESFAQNYSFEGTEGDAVTIELTATSGNLDTVVQLLDASGNVVAQNDDIDLSSINSRIEGFTLPSTGTYTIVASRYDGANGISTGEYTLLLTRSTGTTPPVAENTIAYDSSVTGTITNAQYEVDYTFEGTAGDIVTIEMNATSGDLDTYLVLLGPDQRILQINDDANPSTGSFDSALIGYTLPSTGTYTVVATRFDGSNGSTTGDFELILSSGSLPTNTTTPTISDASGAISYGETVIGTIDNTTFEVVYTFEGTQGDRVSIELTAATGDLDTFLGLVGPTGELIISNDDIDLLAGNTNSAITDYPLPQTGTYSILATRFEGEAGLTSGDFTLSLTSGSSTTTQPPVVSGNALNYGDSVTGTIDGATFEHSYTFEGTAGEAVTIELSATSGDLDSYLGLIGPDGNLLTENDDIDLASGITNSAITNYTLPETGTYTIIATRFDSENGLTSGDFTLTLSQGEATTTQPPVVSGNALSYGNSVTGVIDSSTFEHQYTFEGNAGEAVTIELSALNGDLDTYLSLFGPNGDLLAENDDINLASGITNSAITNFTLPETGTYTILATRYDGETGESAGEFTLTLSQGEATTPPTTTNPPVVSSGGNIQYGDAVAGNISSDTFEQAFSFEGNQGDVITIEMTASDDTLDPYIRLLDPNGNEIAANDDLDFSTRNAAIVEFTLPTRGTYTVVATRFEFANGLTSGGYTLTLTAVSSTALPPTTSNPPINGSTSAASALSYGQVATGNLAVSNLEDRYVFTGQAGDVVTVTMRATSGNLDSYLSILDAQGKEVAFNDNDLLSSKQDAVISSFKLPADGTYTIVATRYGVYYGNTDGAYELTLTVE